MVLRLKLTSPCSVTRQQIHACLLEPCPLSYQSIYLFSFLRVAVLQARVLGPLKVVACPSVHRVRQSAAAEQGFGLGQSLLIAVRDAQERPSLLPAKIQAHTNDSHNRQAAEHAAPRGC